MKKELNLNCTIPYDKAKTRTPNNIANPYTPDKLQQLLNFRMLALFTKEEIAKI